MAFGLTPETFNLKDKTIPVGSILAARVRSVVLDPTTYPDLFKKYGEYASIGGIEFEPVNSPLPKTSEGSFPFAFPLYANIKNYPVENEIVCILVSASPSTGQTNIINTYYYLPSVNIWNSNHHNALPEEIYTDIGLQPSQKKDYVQIGQGSVRRVTDGSTEIIFDNNFKERLDIRPLTQYIGDVTVEGRWGNSVRIGSTNSTSTFPNTWSKVGKEGDPILILRNGQFYSEDNPWIPQSENIQTDKSSVYLTSTQKLSPTQNPPYSTVSFNSNNPPIGISEYTAPQVILAADRVTLAGRDSIIGNATTVHFNTDRFNIDTTGEVTIQSSKTNIGSGNPTDLQPVLKGDTTQELLDDILEALKELTKACSTAATPAGPVASLQAFATRYTLKIQALNTSTIKSDDTFIV